MVPPLIAQVKDVPGLGGELLHLTDGRRFLIVGPPVQHLHAHPFRKGLQPGVFGFDALFPGGFLPGPGKFLLRHEIRQPDQGGPAKVLLAAQVHGAASLLLPQPFQGRHHKIKIAGHAVIAHFAHFDGVRQGKQQAHSPLERAGGSVRIAFAGHGRVLHGRNEKKLRLLRRQIKFPELFFEIKGHGFLLLLLQDSKGNRTKTCHV